LTARLRAAIDVLVHLMKIGDAASVGASRVESPQSEGQGK
jgi:hypothetical protein